MAIEERKCRIGTQTAQVRSGRRVHVAVDEPGTRTHSGVLTAREILG